MSDEATTERVLAAGGVSKRRRNLSNKTGGDRVKNPQSRRPATPEPQKRVFSDDSEASDSETQKRRHEIIRRTRSKERPPQKDTTTEIEDDFEIIRQMHKDKQFEESKAETQQEKTDASDAKIVKELREREVKEMPPLIVAPKEKPKRARPKTLDLKEETPKAKPRSRRSSEEGPKPRARSRTRKVSSSEDDDVNLALKGKLILKPKDEIRKRKIKEPEEPSEEIQPVDQPVEETKPWFFRRWFSQVEAVQTVEEKSPPEEEVKEEIIDWAEDDEEVIEDAKTEEEPKSQRRIFSEWKNFMEEYKDEWLKIRRLRNRCASGLLLITLFCGLGGFIFRFTEGTFESFYKCGVKRVKRDFIDTLWSYSQYMPMEDWKSQARSKLMNFENELHIAHEAGMTSYSGQKSWSFLNAVVYSLTVVTTIGYGHISPVTATGRAITVVYAVIGIPMFLILLADFGKLFTRGIKFLWAFVRRVYYTGSCKKVRKTVPVQDVMKGMQAVYDFARRSSQMPGVPRGNPEEGKPEDPSFIQEQSADTPAPSHFEIDDEFNLPISVAITILIGYILIGATIYSIWEDWSFFECFYFVFISMSTIGFGDFVPNHPMYMMASMVYLVFGLALTSMCINVVQEKLSDTFKQASAKIGATMGLDVVEEGAELNPEPVENAQLASEETGDK